MKIYTKAGDSGKTGLLGGTRVSKAHTRIEAYGTVDELNSWIGVVTDHHTAAHPRIVFLRSVQRSLFTLGSMLAADPAKPGLKIPRMGDAVVTKLEQAIDDAEVGLAPLRAFVLPGGNPLAGFCHVARTVCRRAERAVVVLAEQEEVDPHVIAYLNRLSDYLFVISRAVLHENGIEDIEWHAEVN